MLRLLRRFAFYSVSIYFGMENIFFFLLQKKSISKMNRKWCMKERDVEITCVMVNVNLFEINICFSFPSSGGLHVCPALWTQCDGVSMSKLLHNSQRRKQKWQNKKKLWLFLFFFFYSPEKIGFGADNKAICNGNNTFHNSYSSIVLWDASMRNRICEKIK